MARHTKTASKRRGAQPAGASAQPASLLVALGGSAGALEALGSFFSHVPAGSGLSFVVVVHLDPHHPSMMAELLGRHAAMPVQEASDGVRPQPDHVYVIPPGATLTMEGGALRVTTSAEGGRRVPVDVLFRSLAKDAGEGVAGVVLSGNGSDGTLGLRSIREHGGLTLVQAPHTAAHDSMPRSAIDAGVADQVLPVEQMPERLQAHALQLARSRRPGGDRLDAEIAGSREVICAIVRRRTGHDFSRYKAGTLGRRIRRRLQLRHAASAAEYVRLLEEEPKEPEELVKDLLIGVTQFFRDPQAFEALAEQALPGLLADEARRPAVRIWVPGCASGEEAYSIGMLVREQLSLARKAPLVQIFATDVDGEALTEARQARFPADIREQMSPQRLERFFVPEGDGFRAAQELREMCIFSAHSLVRDPPFSSLDLISCRNLLIYLEADLQAQLVPLFHYALRPGGVLFLGPSEGFAAHAGLFDTVDKKHRLFRRRETLARPTLVFPLSGRTGPRPAAPPSRAEEPTPTHPVLGAAFERMVLEDYAPPCAVVDEGGEVLFVAGRTGRYLQPPPGVLTTNILEVSQGSLRMELRAALRRAVSTRRRAVRDDVPVELDGRTERVRITVRPMPGLALDAGLYAVILQERSLPEDVEAAGQEPEAPAMEQLETELRTTRADLRSAVEERESASEELRSSNEELLSTNEELHSANEELQSSKEELQSVNEELEAVNAELREKVQELGTANSDLQNLFASTAIATLILDRELRVTRFTPEATALFHLIDGDVGRPISDLAPRFSGYDLVADARAVLTTLVPVERQVRSADGATWFVERVLPYRTLDDAIAGVVVTFVDVSKLKRAEDAASRYADLVLLSDDAILSWRLGGVIETWNHGAERLYGFTSDEALGRIPHELLGTVFPRPRQEIEAELVASGRWEGELQQRTGDGRAIAVWSKLQLLRGADGVARVLEKNRDVTERRRMDQELRSAHDRAAWLARFPEENPDPVLRLSGELTLVYANQAAHAALSEARLEAGRAAPAVLAEPARRALSAGERVREEIAQGDRAYSMSFCPVGGEVNVYGQEITSRVRAEEALRQSEQRLRLFIEHAPAAVAMFDREMRYLAVSRRFVSDLRLREEDLLGRSHYQVFPEMPDRWREIHRRCLAGAVERCEEDPFPRADGSLDWVRWEIHPWRDARGEIGGIVLFSEIVTERKRAQDEQRRSRHGLGQLVEASVRVVRETTLRGLLQAVSDVAIELTGARLGVCGHGHVNGAFIVGGASRLEGSPDCPPGQEFVFDKGGVYMGILDGTTPAVRLTDAALRAHPEWWGLPLGHVPMRGLLGVGLRDRQGRGNGMILVTDKVEGEFDAEDETLLRQLGVLASLAAQHVEARLELEEADRRKNEFLAMLSHELRNPLAPISNALYLLERAPGGAEALRAREVLTRQIGQLTRLVDDLLDMTRISRGRIQLRREPVELTGIVRRTVEDHRNLFRAAGVALELEAGEAPLWIDADATRIAQGVGNLLHNAAKFSEAGGRVSVRVEGGGTVAVIRVADGGEGIAAEALPHLFEPFHQLGEAAMHRSRGGLGLGLALVKGLVEMHGGSVAARSEGIGRGAEFTVSLPLLAEAPAARSAPAACLPPPRRRVLVIEDNRDSAETLKAVLELKNQEVELAYDGEAGLARARAFRPELVFCDVGLPGLDGYQVARRIRADPSLAPILVALTGYAAPADRERATEAGFDHHLGKPIELARLDELLAAPGRAG